MKENKKQMESVPFKKGTFGYDLQFLQSKDSVIVLSHGDAHVIVSAKYQGKVFTSSADGLSGTSFGWINYEALNSNTIAPQINAYGGEDRLWLGPEGGQFSIFFKPGSEMVFENWQTPAGLDTEAWNLLSHDATSVVMSKELQLENYSKTRFSALLGRKIKLLSSEEMQEILGVVADPDLKWVGFESANSLSNSGTEKWTKEGGTIGIWMLGMLNPSDSGTVVIPFIQGDEKDLGKIATTNYFGEIPDDRVKIEDGFIFYKVDGKYRSKIGLSEKRATPLAGSYDPINKALTIIHYNKPAVSSEYINQLWEIQEEPFVGDVINSYNDGPLDDGGQLGPFYELETSSPAAFLAPGESLLHTQRIFHFTGTIEQLNAISVKTLGLSLEKIQNAFK